MSYSCKNCQRHLEEIEELGVLTKEELSLLAEPRRLTEVNFPVRMDDGKTVIMSGLRVQYNSSLGPTKGGVRFHHDVTPEEVIELAFLMTLKTSLFELPYGGAKGGLRVNPKKLSRHELERAARGYVRALRKFMGPNEDVPAPDVNTNAEVMAWMLDEFEALSVAKSPAVFTGKPLVLGGSRGRNTSTSRGGYHVIKKLLSGGNPKPTSVAIQGFGNVGSFLAQMLSEDGFKVVAVSDSSSGLCSEDGLNIEDLLSFKEKGKRFEDRPEQHISNEDLLLLDVDLLIPAALGGVIDKTNASNIRAKTIVEMANAPITAEADEILAGKGITVVPDVLSNAGGVVVSYFEWAQNLQGMMWDESRVEEELKNRMEKVYERVSLRAEEVGCSLRHAAYLEAMGRVVEAERLRGNI